MKAQYRGAAWVRCDKDVILLLGWGNRTYESSDTILAMNGCDIRDVSGGVDVLMVSFRERMWSRNPRNWIYGEISLFIEGFLSGCAMW